MDFDFSELLQGVLGGTNNQTGMWNQQPMCCPPFAGLIPLVFRHVLVTGVQRPFPLWCSHPIGIPFGGFMGDFGGDNWQQD